MRSANDNLKRNRKANDLESTVNTINRGIDAANLIGSGMHLTAITGAKKIIFAVQIRWSVRKAIVFGNRATYRIRLQLNCRRRCVAGSLSTVNNDQTT